MSASAARHRFVLVTGKGGVGKTTVCAALATRLAAEGQRVLLAMCNAKERASTMLGSEPIGAEVVPAAENVWAVNMTPEKALEEYGLLVVKSRALYNILFDNKYVRTFFRAVPGVQEWAMLGKAWWHTTEVVEGGRPRFDVVILDAPATGHGLDMLRVPKIISEVAPPGLLRRDADRAIQLFRDPHATAVVLVTLPEEMPVTETLELSAALRGELGLPIARVVVNAVLPALFSPSERGALEGLAPFTPAHVGDAAVLAGRARAIRERVQTESIERLRRGLPLPTTLLPMLLGDAMRPAAIRKLADHLDDPSSSPN
jgi:anion-transporting  ArsA/GET3 family ATPase